MTKTIEDVFAEEALEAFRKKEIELNRGLTYLEQSRLEDDLLSEWLENNRIDDCLNYILWNYEVYGGNGWCKLLASKLEDARDVNRIHKLFRGLIPGRQKQFWFHLPYAKKGSITSIANAAFHKSEVLNLFENYHRILLLLEENEDAEKLKNEIYLFNSEKKYPNK